MIVTPGGRPGGTRMEVMGRPNLHGGGPGGPHHVQHHNPQAGHFQAFASNYGPFLHGMASGDPRLRHPAFPTPMMAAVAAATAAAAAQQAHGGRPGTNTPGPHGLPLPHLIHRGVTPPSYPGLLDLRLVGGPGAGLHQPPAPAASGHPPPAPGGDLHIPNDVLDSCLYGYAQQKTGEQNTGHALSGLRVGQLSHGIDRILGSGYSTPVKQPQAQAVVDPSTLDLPEGIELVQTTFAGTAHYGIFCKKTVIAKGTRFGPFRGRQVNTSEIKTNDDNTYMWEIFQDGKLSHYIDGRGSAGNWMAYVNCARYAQEQNLIALQNNQEIYYEACKDIAQGTELLVWYGDCYLQFMGIPVALKEMADGIQHEDPQSSEGYQCERCGKVFAYKYYRDKHLKYTRCVDQGDRKFPCHLCTRSFEKRDRLRIHILHVHEKHRPHKCTVCSKSFSQSSSLNKHMRVHSGERPYKCVYCSKAFTASSILRTHIRQHSGEKPFKCMHCGKAFASHAAHDSHVRRTHMKERPCVCNICGKAFPQPYELKFHMSSHNGESGRGLMIKRLGSTGSSDSSAVDFLEDEGVGSLGVFRRGFGAAERFQEEIDVVGLDQKSVY